MVKYFILAILLGTLGTLVFGADDDRIRIYFGSGSDDLHKLLASLNQTSNRSSNRTSNPTGIRSWFQSPRQKSREPSRQQSREPSRQLSREPSRQYSYSPESQYPQQQTHKSGYNIVHKIQLDENTRLQDIVQGVGGLLASNYYEDQFRNKDSLNTTSIRLCCDDNVELTNCVEMQDYEADEDCSRKVVYRQSEMYAATPNLVKYSWSENTIGRGGPSSRGNFFSNFSEPRQQNGHVSQQPRNLGNFGSFTSSSPTRYGSYDSDRPPTYGQNTRWNATPPPPPPPSYNPYSNNHNQNQNYRPFQRSPSFQNSDRWGGSRGYEREPEPEPVPRSIPTEWFNPSRFKSSNNPAPQPEQRKPVASSSGVNYPTFNPQQQRSVSDTPAYKSPQQRPIESSPWSQKPAAKPEPGWSYWGSALPSETAKDNRPKISPPPSETAKDNRPKISPPPSVTAKDNRPKISPPPSETAKDNRPKISPPPSETAYVNPPGSSPPPQPSKKPVFDTPVHRPPQKKRKKRSPPSQKPAAKTDDESGWSYWGPELPPETAKAKPKKTQNKNAGKNNGFNAMFGKDDNDDDSVDDDDDDDDDQPYVYRPIDLDEFRADMVERHNFYRRKHGIQEFTETVELNSTALEYANTLAAADPGGYEMQHSEFSNTQVGENLMFSSCRMHNLAFLAVDDWWSEISFCSVDDTAAKILSLMSTGIGHVTQVLWISSIRLGCGFARSKEGNYYVVCHYDPPGNYGSEYLVIKNVPFPFSEQHIAEAKALNKHITLLYSKRKGRPISNRPLTSEEDASDPENVDIEGLLRRLLTET